MNKHDKIYVAGHKGLIGSAIYAELQARGYTNLVVKTHQELELKDAQATQAFFEVSQPDCVILAAGKVGGIVQNQEIPAEFLTENLKIQLNVIENAHKYGVKQLVLFGSSCMYPRECPQPMNEEALLSAKPEITSLSYAMSKLAGVQLCHAFNLQYHYHHFMPVIPNSVFGPFDNFDPKGGHVLSALIRRFHEAKQTGAPFVELWGTGTPRREFIFSSDAAKAVITLMETGFDGIETPVNLGSGIDYSIKELAETIRDIVGYNGEIRWDTSKKDGAPQKLLDSSRLKAATGWEPQVSLKDGIEATYRWYKENCVHDSH